MTGIDSKAERRLAARTAESQARDYLAQTDWSHVSYLASTAHRVTVEEGSESGMVRVNLASDGSRISLTLFAEQARQLWEALAPIAAHQDGAA